MLTLETDGLCHVAPYQRANATIVDDSFNDKPPTDSRVQPKEGAEIKLPAVAELVAATADADDEVQGVGF